MTQGAIPPRFIVFSPRGGLGDTMAGLGTAFLGAILSKRVLLLDWKTGEQGFVSPNLPNIWIKPNQYGAFDETSEDNFLIASSDSKIFSHFFERALQVEPEVIKYSGNRGHVSSFFSSKYQHLALDAGLQQETAYGCLINFLLDWSPAIQSKFSREIGLLLDPNAFTVGIHIRAYNKGGDLAKREREKPARLSSFSIPLHCASDLDKKFNFRKKIARWLVVSDSPKLRKEIKSKYGKHVIIAEDLKIGDGQDYNSSGSGKIAPFAAAVGEMWMLGLADKLVVMDRSGFGRIGAGRSLKIRDIYSVRTNARVYKGCKGKSTSMIKLATLGAGL